MDYHSPAVPGGRTARNRGNEMTTKEVADRLVALCRAGKNIEAVETLLSADVVSVEAVGDATMPAVMSGNAAVRGKNEWWFQNHKVHRSSVKGPYPNGDRFALIFDFEVTPAVGPMAGRRIRMEEVALYTVSDGKVAREEFFYDMTGGLEAAAVAKRKKAVRKKARKAAPKANARPAAKKKAKGKAKTRR